MALIQCMPLVSLTKKTQTSHLLRNVSFHLAYLLHNFIVVKKEDEILFDQKITNVGMTSHWLKKKGNKM